MIKFNMEQLEKICGLKEKQFKQFGKYDKTNRYFFKDNNSRVLGVAHLDTVCQPTHFKHLVMPHRELVFSPTLDDRLGAFLLLDHLPKLGIKFDILLTTDEEIGRSTAEDFETEKQYNWIFQFDRAGTDVVMYDYETPELKKKLKKFGWEVGYGSFTDISFLEFLDCKGFNFGTCYEDYHSYNAYADLTKLYENIALFKTFYEKFKNIYLPHKESSNIRGWQRKSYPSTDYVERDAFGYTQDWIDERYNDEFGIYNEHPKEHDIWRYTCSSCHKPVSLDLDDQNNHVDAFDAAEEGFCLKCFHKYIYEVSSPENPFFH